MSRCVYMEDISDTESVCRKGLSLDETCESGEKIEGGGAFACWYFEPAAGVTATAQEEI